MPSLVAKLIRYIISSWHAAFSSTESVHSTNQAAFSDLQEMEVRDVPVFNNSKR